MSRGPMQMKTFRTSDSDLGQALTQLDQEVENFLSNVKRVPIGATKYATAHGRTLEAIGNQTIVRVENGYVVCMPIVYREYESSDYPVD